MFVATKELIKMVTDARNNQPPLILDDNDSVAAFKWDSIRITTEDSHLTVEIMWGETPLFKFSAGLTSGSAMIIKGFGGQSELHLK